MKNNQPMMHENPQEESWVFFFSLCRCKKKKHPAVDARKTARVVFLFCIDHIQLKHQTTATSQLITVS
jgi:hypothetical protein